MQRLLSKLRPFATISSSSSSPTRTLLHPFPLPSSPSSSYSFHRPALLHSASSAHHSFPLDNPPVFNSLSRTLLNQTPHLGFQSIISPLSLNQCRHVSKAKERRLKRLTPAVSKLKKYKIKPYSSYKSRFRTLKDGRIRCWHAGKRHNAHLKSKISKRRLRLPALVHPAYAKVMKKLNFYG